MRDCKGPAGAPVPYVTVLTSVLTTRENEVPPPKALCAFLFFPLKKSSEVE